MKYHCRHVVGTYQPKMARTASGARGTFFWEIFGSNICNYGAYSDLQNIKESTQIGFFHFNIFHEGV